MNLSDPVLSAILIAFIPSLLLRGNQDSHTIPIRTVIVFELQLAVTAVMLGTRSNLIWVGIIPISSVLIEVVKTRLVRRNDDQGYLLELLASIVKLTTVLIIAGYNRFVPGFGPMIHIFITYVKEHNSILASVSPAQLHSLLIVAVGIVLAGFEANHLVTSVLKGLSLMPTSNTNENIPPVKEAARGRIIGIVERSLVFMLTVNGVMSAIVFIVTAKAFARFKDLDERAFAEYVLIGTLLSIGSAIGIGLLLMSEL